MSIKNQIADAEAELARIRKEKMTPLGATFNSLGQGLTFGFSDELAAGLVATFTSPFSNETFNEIYDRQVEEERSIIKAGQEKYPLLSLTGEIAGGIPTGLGMFRAGAIALKNAPRLAKIMGIGAVEGGIYGAGVAEEGGTIEGATRGAGFGAALGPVGTSGGHVAGRLVDKVVLPVTRIATETPKGEAIRIIRKKLADDEINPAQAQRELNELGPEAVLADVQGGIQGLADVVATGGGGPRTIAENVLHGRQRSQQQRILEGVGVNPDEVGTFRMNVHQLINNRQTQAGPHYQRAYQTFIAPDTPRTFVSSFDGEAVTTSLTDLLKVIPKDFQAKAKNLMLQDVNYLEQIKKGFPDTPVGRRDALQAFRDVDTNSLRYYDYLKRALDDGIGASTRKGTSEVTRNLTGQKNRLLDYLDQASPDYKKAREIYAGERELRSAVEYGRSLMSNKTDLAEVELAIGAMSGGEKQFLRQGIIRGLVDKLESTKEMSNFASNLVETRRARELLGYAFPDEDSFNRFINNMVAENRFSYTRNRVLGGSPTAPRLAGSKDLASETQMGQALRSADPLTIGMVTLREITGRETSPQTLDALANFLFRGNKIPETLAETTRRTTRGLGQSTGLTGSVITGERVRDDVGGEPEDPASAGQ